MNTLYLHCFFVVSSPFFQQGISSLKLFCQRDVANDNLMGRGTIAGREKAGTKTRKVAVIDKHFYFHKKQGDGQNSQTFFSLIFHFVLTQTPMPENDWF